MSSRLGSAGTRPDASALVRPPAMPAAFARPASRGAARQPRSCAAREDHEPVVRGRSVPLCGAATRDLRRTSVLTATPIEGYRRLWTPAPGDRETEATMNETITGRCQVG